MALYLHLVAPLLTLLWIPLGEGGSFWHMTDIHLDNFYSEGGDRANYCRNSSFQSSVMDSGDYQCDSPLLLLKSAVLAMNKFEPNPDFILWTGDSNPHWRKQPDGKPGPDFPYIWQNMKIIHKLLVESFPNSTLVPVLGNHDAFPADSFPDFQNTSDINNIYTNYLKNGSLGDFITGSSRDTFKRCGYYRRDVLTSKNATIRLLNLNTNIYYNNPRASGSDPCGQLEWLEKELNLAKTSDHIYVTAHVPPGAFERQPHVSFFNSPAETALHIQKRFIDILRTPAHADKIVAHFYGHIHTDTFRLLKDSAREDEVRGVAFLANSITPVLWDGRDKSDQLPAASIGTNPAIRLFQFHDSDASLLDYTQYGLDLDAIVVDESGKKTPQDEDLESLDEKAAQLANKWKLIYNATTSFNIKSLSKKEMTLAYKAMIPEGSAVFNRYYKHNTNNHVVDSGDCDAKCQRGHLCTISNFLPGAITSCLESNDTSHFLYTKVTNTKQTQSHKPLYPTSRTPLQPVQDVYDSFSSSDKAAGGDKDSGEQEHDSNFTSAPGKGSVDRKPMEDTGSYDGTVKGVGIFLAVAAMAILILIVFVAVRKFRANRYRNQGYRPGKYLRPFDRRSE